MNDTQLTYFLAVYDCGGYTAAANAMFTSRQALGRAVSELEKEMGAPLFARKGRGIEPTPLGSEAAEIARSIIDDIHKLKNLSGLEDEPETRDQPFVLAIADSPSRGSIFDAEELENHLSQIAYTSFDIQFLPADSCAYALENSIVDAAIVLGRIEDPLLSSEFIGREPACLAVSKNNPLASKSSLGVEDLKDIKLAQPESLGFLYPRINTLCTGCEFNPSWTFVGTGAEELLEFTKSGGGVFVHPRTPLQDTGKVCLVPMDESTSLTLPFFFVERRQERSSLSLSIMRAITELFNASR